MNAVQMFDLAVFQPVEHHGARLVYRRQLGRVAKQDQGGKDLFQVFKLAVIQHRGFINETDIERVFAPFPAGDEIRPTQTCRRQRAGN